MVKRIVLVLFICSAVGAGVWAFLYFAGRQTRVESARESTNEQQIADAWSRALEKVKANRTDPALNTSIEIPPELRHYSERHWFLATQVAEIEKHNVPICQDFVELAAMIQRGEMVAVPAVTETYVLYGVGEKADIDEFTRYEDNRSIELYSTFGPEVRFSIRPANQNSIDGFESLWTLAKNFGGRTYNLNNSSDRQAMKVQMLRSIRPQAMKIIEEVASAYHHKFALPLPISSLVRPEQYQRQLRKVNRNAVLIETPPHSTGLAFDIDYRYMTGAEQTFVMAELARLKKEGRTEVIRERNANYHVFAFVNGSRPSDDLITASLEKARTPVQAANHVAQLQKVEVKPEKAKSRTAKSKPRKRRR